MLQALTWAAAGTGFTALMTAAGAAVVFLFHRKNSQTLHRVMLGFAAGVMIAASMWSLLIPAIEKAEELGQTGWLPAAGGSLLGIGFLLGMDFLLPHFVEEGKSALVIAVGCTGGRHRSVAVTHALCEYIQGLGYGAGETHRDMTRA